MRLHPEDVKAIAEQVAALLSVSAAMPRTEAFEERDLSSLAHRAVLAKKLKNEQRARQSV